MTATNRPVCLIAGHRIDEPDRARPRFPASLEPAVENAIRNALATLDPRLAYLSAASGVDLIALGILAERNIESHLVLPFTPERFRELSLSSASASWHQRFRQALASATSVEILGLSAKPYIAAADRLGMRAELAAQGLGTSQVGIFVLDPLSSRGPGGTHDCLQRWSARGCQATLIDLRELNF